MRYGKPILSLIGATASIVLGSSTAGKEDHSPESNRKARDIDEDLDD